jgi:hypothetical protein
VFTLRWSTRSKRRENQPQLDKIIAWLIRYDAPGLAAALDGDRDVDSRFARAPVKNQNLKLIKRAVCGALIADIKNPTTQMICYLDTLVDELARGKKFENILRG